MNFIKQNWRQGLTVAASVVVAGLLLTHKITEVEAVAVGGLLAAAGVHLPAIVYSADKVKE